MLHPRIKKELRLVAAPSGILASFALILLFLWKIESAEMWNSIFSFFGLGLALSYFVTCQFGSELSLQNLGWGMSMSWSRQQFWREKLKVMLPLYVTLSAFSIFCIFLFHHREAQYLGAENSAAFFILCFVSMAWVCMGPGIFLTLKLRNLVASLWLTCLLPFILTFLLFMMLDNTGMSDSQFGYLMFTVALIYGGAGWWLARAAFLTWEDKGMQATEMDWNLFGLFNRSNGPASYRYQPWKAMVFRELRLQQTNLVLGGFLLATAFVSGVLGRYENMDKWIGEEPARFLSFVPQLIRHLILLIPASLACVTVAESRRLDVHVGELIGPLRRRSQFVVKFTVTVFLGWFIGGFLPSSIEAYFAGGFARIMRIGLITQLLAPLIAIVSLYAGSFCGGYLKSFSLTLLIIPLIVMLRGEIYGLIGNHSVAVGFWSFFFMQPFLLWRSYRNSVVTVITKSLVLRNVVQMFGAFLGVILLLKALEDRSWERVTLREPKHETSILKAGVEPSIHFDFNKLFLLSPDGNIWLLENNRIGSSRRHGEFDKVIKLPVEQQIGPLTQFASNYYARFVLDSQKHLWMWTARSEGQWMSNQTSLELIPMMQERTWEQISAGRGGFVAVASDGTLWSGGQSHPKKPALAELPELAQVDVELPTRWEQESGPVFDIETGPHYIPVKETFTDWKDCLMHNEMFFALRENGQLYAWGKSASTYEWNRLTLARTYLRDIYSRKWKVKDISGTQRGKIIITTDDGYQWISSKDTNRKKHYSHHNQQSLVHVAAKNSSTGQAINDWISFSERSFLSKNGTIWKITGETYSKDNLPQQYKPYAIGEVEYHVNRMGDRNDWVAQLGNYGMTADGKLWNWDLRNRNQLSPIPPRFRHKVIVDLNP